jgi:hypothetical protein
MGSIDWIDLAQEKNRRLSLVNVVMNSNEHSDSTKCWEFLD